MKKNYIIFSLLAIVLVFNACKPLTEEEKKEKELKELSTKQKELLKEQKDINKKLDSLQGNNKKDSVRSVPVQVMSMYPEVFNTYVELQGRVDADDVVNASPEAPGVVQRIHVQHGSYVRKGQQLATLKAETIANGLDELEHQISFAKIMYDKQKRLWAQDIGTQVQLLTAKNNYEALLKQRKTIKSQRSMYSITSPINGVVDEIGIKVGEMASPGMPNLFRVVNTSRLKVKVNVPESYAGKVTSGKRVQLEFADLGDTMQSRIGYMQKTINQASRTFNAEIPLPSNGRIQPNMATKVKIVTYENNRAFVLPIRLLQRIKGASYVFVVDGENKAKLKRVETGNTYNGDVEILDGLTLDDLVVTAGFEELNEGELLSYTN